MSKGPQHFVQIGGDADFVVKKILQPEIVMPLGHRDQWQEISDADADGGLLSVGVIGIERFRVDAQVHGHGMRYLPVTFRRGRRISRWWKDTPPSYRRGTAANFGISVTASALRCGKHGRLLWLGKVGSLRENG